MDANFELALAKLAVRQVAQNGSLSDAESLLKVSRETVAFLERRIAREKLSTAKQVNVVNSEAVRAS